MGGDKEERWVSGNAAYFRMNRVLDIYFVGGFGTVQVRGAAAACLLGPGWLAGWAERAGKGRAGLLAPARACLLAAVRVCLSQGGGVAQRAPRCGSTRGSAPACLTAG